MDLSSNLITNFELLDFSAVLSDQIMNLNHSRVPMNTHTKFHRNRFSRLGGVQSHTDGHKKYIYKDIN